MYVDLIEKAAQELPLTAIITPWTEYAWKYEDFPEILRYFQNQGWIVLGGDILTLELTHTLDNWYYNPESGLSEEENVLLSCETAERYLGNYRNRKGSDYYIVFVVTRRFP